ncbi:MAG: phage tail sheath subtilisin-like domain-containing protein, partial [Chloroflexi bacterium]|nr:phage tail sheath subtilisin-like domain-containing protein [Chloroflexota bacterium]
MPTYLSPGVYIVEEDRGTKPIESVGTAVAAFVGYTAKAEEKLDGGGSVSLLNKATAVVNWSQFVDKFGAFVDGAYLPDAVYGYFQNGGGRCYIVSIKTVAPPEGALLGVRLLSAGEKPTDVLQIQAKSGAKAAGAKVTVKPDEGQETFTLIIQAPGGIEESFSGLTTAKGDTYVETAVQSKVITVKVLKAGVLPAVGTFELVAPPVPVKPVAVADYRGEVAERTGLGGLEALDEVTILAVPDLMKSYQAGEMSLADVQAVQQAIYEHCEKVKYCFAILDCPPDLKPQQVREWRLKANYDSKYAALYYPWIEVSDMVKGKGTVRVPPSGHIAGVYARTDAERGVHKAPANEVVRGATGLPVQVTQSEQDSLNPLGINCIRSFPGRGLRVWGARTLSSDPAWRYINVRRLFNMVEESIERGTQWVVFEPNDLNLWARVRRDVTAYLKTVWSSGALFGATPNQAFYVKCDEELN